MVVHFTFGIELPFNAWPAELMPAMLIRKGVTMRAWRVFIFVRYLLFLLFNTKAQWVRKATNCFLFCILSLRAIQNPPKGLVGSIATAIFHYSMVNAVAQKHKQVKYRKVLFIFIPSLALRRDKQHGK